MNTKTAELTQQIIQALQQHVRATNAPLLKEIEILRQQAQQNAHLKALPGPAGEAGPPGEPGRDGRDGMAGRDGEPGRDALAISPLDAIDPERSYARGTYACHQGGLVNALRATEPLPADGDLERAGWRVIVRGLDDLAVELGADLRSVQELLCLVQGVRTILIKLTMY